MVSANITHQGWLKLFTRPFIGAHRLLPGTENVFGHLKSQTKTPVVTAFFNFSLSICKIMKSIFQIRSMQLQGDGLYTALLLKVFAYLLALRWQAQGVFSTLTRTEIMRKVRREEDLRDFLMTHFHAPFSIG